MRPGIHWVLESPSLGELFANPSTGVALFADEIEAGRNAAALQQMLAEAVREGFAGKNVDSRDWRAVRAFVLQYPSFMYRRFTPEIMTGSLLAAVAEHLDSIPELERASEAQLREAGTFEWVVGA